MKPGLIDAEVSRGLPRFIADAEREIRRLLELERELRFLRVALFGKGPRHANGFQ